MGKHTQVGVIGSAIFAPRNPERTSLEEALHAATKAALRNAGLAIEDIDGIVVASCDQLDGRAISIMMASGSVGGVGRDILSTPSSSEHAFVLATLRVRSGMYQTQLVVSWSPLEVNSISETQRLSNDPYFHRALPLDDLASHALQANSLEASVPGLRAAAVAVTEKNRRHGAYAHPEYASAPREPVLIANSKMLRWPITEGMVSPPAFAVVALVLASGDWIGARGGCKTAWVHGTGWATETAFLGDRDLATLPSLAAAAKQAYDEAGVDAQSPKFDLAEVADATPYQELVALEGLGICQRGKWVDAVNEGAFTQGGALPVNLSGGASSFNPVFCTGLMRIAEAAAQVRGSAGVHQLATARKAVAHGASGFAMQYNTVVVFGQEPREIKQ
jgi:acetyl-CoA C-acetyltransferase